MSETLVPHTMQPPPNARQVLLDHVGTAELIRPMSNDDLLRIGKLLADAQRKWDRYWRDTHCAVCGVAFDRFDLEHHHGGMFNRTCREHMEFAHCYDLRYELERRNMPPPFVNPDFWTP